MKRQFLSLFASAVMLCAAAALFAYNPATPATAKTGATNAALIPIPAALDHALIKVAPANDPSAVGEEITVAKLSEIFATKNPGLANALASKFKSHGWDWTAQTKVKVTTARYRVAPGETTRIAPPGWDWRQVVAVAAVYCGCCDSDCNTELDGGNRACCMCCRIE